MTIRRFMLRRPPLAVLAVTSALLLAVPGYRYASGVHDPAAPTASERPGEPVLVEVAAVNGSGCPRGTALVTVSPDNTSFKIIYRAFHAKVGVGAKSIDFRKNCQLNLRLRAPEGHTYAIAQVDYHGYAHLEDGATALQRGAFYAAGSPATSYTNHPVSGPYDGAWNTSDEVDVGELIWARCGEERSLNVNTDLRVYAGASDPTTTASSIALHSAEGSVSSEYHFAWRHWPGSS